MRIKSNHRPDRSATLTSPSLRRGKHDKKMKNETNFRKAKMNVNLSLTKNYEMNSLADPANTNPISSASGGFKIPISPSHPRTFD